jgi:predicted  nucleic acid-binding Zn-ribbon protein
MDHRRLYEIKIESLEQQIKTLMKGQVQMQDEILELRDEVFDWKEKYKELRKTITL